MKRLMKKLLVLIVICTSTFALKTEAKIVRGSFDIEFGKSDGKGGCVYVPFSICSITISLRTKGNSGNADTEIIDFSGEVMNNKLVINLSKEINGKEKNSRGTYAYILSKQMDLDADLAKELGFEKLSIAPGNYEFSGKTLSLKIVSPRDPASGQASGKRSGIAIDEQGVHKEEAPKATYNQKENKK
jgi:hypothetical protein